MNYKPLIRKNKRTIKDLSAMVLWLFILIFLIQYTARTGNTNSGLDHGPQVSNIEANNTITKVGPLKTLTHSNSVKAGAPYLAFRK